MATKLRENPLQAANTHTQSKTCYAVWSHGDGSAIAAAESGTFFHINQGNVQAFEIPSTSDFYDVHGFTPDDVWAVGTFGAIWRFNGSNWFPIEDNPSAGTYDPTWFEAVWGTSSDNIYVCGDNSEILHFDGNSWTYILKWDRVSPKQFPDRWYSMAGTDDGTLYAVGSPYRNSNGTVKAGFVRIRPGSTPELLDVQTSTPFLNAITRIPGTNELLLCGGNGTLRRIKGNEITAEASDIIRSNDKFYAIEAVNQNNIVVVGWGVLLTYDGNIWERKTVAGRPYLEGIAYSGQGTYTAVGWMGKILTFDLSNNRWDNLQNGRVSSTLAVTALNDGSVIASTDGGNLIVGNSRGHLQQRFSLTLDLSVAANLNENKVLLAGQNGYIAEVSITSDGELTYHSERGGNERWSVYCGSTFGHGAYLGCSRLVINKWSNGQLTEVQGVADRIRAADPRDKLGLNELIHLSDTEFVVRVNQRGKGPLTTYLVDLNEDIAQRLDIASKDIVVGSHGATYVISDYIVYYAHNVRNRNSWEALANISSQLISADEAINCGSIFENSITLGGTRGTILQLDANGSVSLTHSGSYTRIDCLAVTTNGVTFAGQEWGRLKRVDIEHKHVSGFSISAPTWWAALSTNSGTLLCGQDGSLGFLGKELSNVELSAPLLSKDYLCCVDVSDSMKCLAGVETIVLWKEFSPHIVHKIPNKVITALNYFNSMLYLGTSRGEVFTIRLDDLMSSQVQNDAIDYMITPPLNSPVIDLAILPSGTRITCEDGKVFFYDNELSLLHDLKATIRRGAVPQNSEEAYCAGIIIRKFQTNPKRRMFVAKLKGEDNLEEITFPTGFGGKLFTRDVSTYAPDEVDGFWFGGQSGELVVTVNDNWYQVSTGIGNQLHSITTTHDRLVVCGRFGAVRFGDMNIFRDRIDELSSPAEGLLETTKVSMKPDMFRPEFNLSVVERRMVDMSEFVDYF